MNFLVLASTGGDVGFGFGFAYWTLAPYMIGAHWYGVCCTRRILCPNSFSAFLT
jgi:hypothetical protein